MQADRCGIGRIADHGQHLARAARFALRQQFGQQQLADALSLGVFGEVDRILQAKAVGAAGNFRARQLGRLGRMGRDA